MDLGSGPETGPSRLPGEPAWHDPTLLRELVARTTTVGGANVTPTCWPIPGGVRRFAAASDIFAPRRLVLGLLLGLVLICATHPSPAAARARRAAASRAWLKACCRTQGNRHVLVLWGVAPRGGAYLGCSFCPVGTRDVARDGIHHVTVVRGRFAVTFAVPARALGGTYQAAVWLHKVPAARCTIPHCEWCRRNGYHLATMLAWSSGSLR